MKGDLEEEVLKLRRAVGELSILNEIAVAIGSTMKVEESPNSSSPSALKESELNRGR